MKHKIIAKKAGGILLSKQKTIHGHNSALLLLDNTARQQGSLHEAKIGNSTKGLNQLLSDIIDQIKHFFTQCRV